MLRLLSTSFQIFLITTVFTNCVNQAGNRRIAGEALKTDPTPSGGGTGNGTGAGPNNGNVNQGGGTTTVEGSTELRHFVDPFTGTYKSKLTLPKNFSGLLYLSGLNVTALKSKLVHVRFKFGKEYEPITIPATVARPGPGIIPQIDIQVLMLDVQNHAFENIRLLYDLYDYNTYMTGDVPTTDPRNTGLYCRGLHLEDDSTFKSSNNDNICNDPGEACLYTYAKVVDRGLVYKDGTGNPISTVPTNPHVDLSGTDYTTPTGTTALANNLTKCLPDNGQVKYNGVIPTSAYLNISGSTNAPQSLVSPAHVSAGVTYYYQGPYRPISTSSWEITSGAAIYDHVNAGVRPTGIFMQSLDGTLDGGILSLMFPLMGTKTLSAGINYVGSASALGTLTAAVPYVPVSRTLQTILTSGESLYMDGCNVRVSNYDSYLNEGIQSCNVTAKIEVVTIDPVSAAETIISSSRDLKLQLIRPSTQNSQGRETLYSAFKSCSSSKTCGSGECCFNSRCWSKDLVSQCIEDADTQGNLGIGDACATDFQCSSLCCNRSTSTCAVHKNNDPISVPVLCSKSPGDTCVAKEYCRKDNIRQCFIVKTGLSPLGETTCALRCYNVPTFGSCRNGFCVPPANPTVPIFDPSNPNCTTAIDPPTDLSGTPTPTPTATP